LGLSWDEAWGIQARAVKRGQARKEARVVTQLGVDEKAAAKGHTDLTLVCDLEQATVEYSGEDRTTASLDAYDLSLSDTQRAGIVPEAAEKIVFDRFHIMGHMGKAVESRPQARTPGSERGRG
jgi:transposase